MIVLGVILLIVGIVVAIPVLTDVGLALLLIGALLWVMGAVGRPVAGRRYWY